MIDLQRQAGIGVYTDGELRRSGWAGDFGEAVEGFIVGEPPVRMPFQGGKGDWEGPGITPENPMGMPGTAGGRASSASVCGRCGVSRVTSQASSGSTRRGRTR